MIRILFLTDFSEEYAKMLLKGIVEYSKVHEACSLCKMPLSYRAVHGIEGVLDWALKWEADAIIGQFFPTDDVSIFKQHGIIAIAQDFKERFDSIPNITGTHLEAGNMGAEYFINKGYSDFAFYGYKGVVWSEERCLGFKNRIYDWNVGARVFEYQNPEMTDLWYYKADSLTQWLQMLPKPIAIMACDDNQAHHIVEICNKQGIRIPEDVAILGVDNDDAVCSLCIPPLSSVNQNVEKGGYETAEMISKMIKNPNMPIHDIVVKSTYISTRSSTDIYATKDVNIQKVLKYIHTNCHRRLNVEELLEIVPMSRRLLEVRFREVTGQPIYGYILDLRMDRFARQLIETNLPLTDIAFEQGLSDYKYAARLFKKNRGLSPTEYRKKYSTV